jgi:hypothetical protein
MAAFFMTIQPVCRLSPKKSRIENGSKHLIRPCGTANNRSDQKREGHPFKQAIHDHFPVQRLLSNIAAIGLSPFHCAPVNPGCPETHWKTVVGRDLKRQRPSSVY